MRILLPIFIFLVACPCLGQARADVLLAAHRDALGLFLQKNPNLTFESEKIIPNATLKEMKGYFGSSFKPYYLIWDFNRDGVKDFAVLLGRNLEPIRNEGIREPYDIDFHWTLVVFNGRAKGGFYAAFQTDIIAPTPCFIRMGGNKTKHLYFAVYESDADTFELVPTKRTYIVQHETR